MAWCRVSSLTAAVTRSLRDARFLLPRSRVLRMVDGKTIEGWDLEYFLGKALTRRSYSNLKEVLADLDEWLDKQG